MLVTQKFPLNKIWNPRTAQYWLMACRDAKCTQLVAQRGFHYLLKLLSENVIDLFAIMICKLSGVSNSSHSNRF